MRQVILPIDSTCENWEELIPEYQDKGYFFIDLGKNFGNVETYCDIIIPIINENPETKFVTSPLFWVSYLEAKNNYLSTGIKAFLEETNTVLFWEKVFKNKIKVDYEVEFGL